MKTTHKPAEFVFNTQTNCFSCSGGWSILLVEKLLDQLKSLGIPSSNKLRINGKAITQFDSAGAIALLQVKSQLQALGNFVELEEFNPQYLKLFALVEEKSERLNYQPPPPKAKSILYQVGEETFHKLDQARGLNALVGDLTEKLILSFKNWRRFQIPSILTNIYTTGVTALPILAMLSLLIGVVLAYQLGLQLEHYGANTFIAYLSGMAIFREFAPLITAIIVAGRTSSAFTAQLGSMKINEEIDALYTMGLSPTELLVVPKVLGLLLIFPLLIFWSDFFGILGAMIMSKGMLQVGYLDFLSRLQESVGFKQMLLGLYKAPTFALLIALVGCFQGFQVEANADSVGTQTTKSVVQALFLIIVADAFYSIIYSWLDL